MIVGHRGTGKTSLLKRWQRYCPDFTFADLDEEIEKLEGRTVHQIFSDLGETAFRDLEKKVWNLIQDRNIISVGGGFDLELISESRKILWVRRDSDTAGKVFLDRPIISDYEVRHQFRETQFNKKANLIYTLPEGDFGLDNDIEEKEILTGCLSDIGGAVTLPRRTYPNCLIETRDDLETQYYHTQDIIYSVRVGNSYPLNTKIDWDIKNPIPSGLQPFIISTHEKSPDILLMYEKSEAILKYCPQVNSWSELKAGYSWQKKNPTQRVFLPRSENGKWTWFRLWMKNRQPLNFWREGMGTAPDQPTLWEWLSQPKEVSSFAAVLGCPVRLSFSPVYHKAFFKKRNMPFYRIEIEESEWDEAFLFLCELGLVAAAVTSPLKNKAGNVVRQNALNTLWKCQNKWFGANTDQTGAQILVEEFTDKSSVFWGGGGVLETFKHVLPNTSFYSARSGKPRDGYCEVNYPEILYWGDPHNSIKNIPKTWKPQVVVDLSYHDQSPAKIYSKKINSRYVSGLKMFLKQAELQQQIWGETNNVG